jgi:hypothetical protein
LERGVVWQPARGGGTRKIPRMSLHGKPRIEYQQRRDYSGEAHRRGLHIETETETETKLHDGIKEYSFSLFVKKEK